MRITPIKMIQPLKPEVKKIISFKEQKQLFKKVEKDSFTRVGK